MYINVDKVFICGYIETIPLSRDICFGLFTLFMYLIFFLDELVKTS